MVDQKWKWIAYLFIRMNQAHCFCLLHQRRASFSGFCLQVFRPAGPPPRVNCLPRMGNKREVSFLRTQRQWIADSIDFMYK